MSIPSYTAEELLGALVNREDFILLDVRNSKDYDRFKIEGPYPIDMLNIVYYDFQELEDECVPLVPEGRKIRIVCAKESSAKYVAGVLSDCGYNDVAYLEGGIRTWGNLLSPVKAGTGPNYEVYQFRRPGKASLSYVLESGREMFVFDPSKNVAFYQQFAKDHGCTITRTFETHRQADYISGSDRLRRDAGAEIVAPQPDFDVARFPYTAVSDGDVFAFSDGGPKVRAIHTPGHTPGSTSYLIDDRYLISGDAVFLLSIGRPDLGGKAEEWSRLLFKTMTEKIIKWDRSLIVLPGHYMDWREAKNQVFADTLENVIENNAEIYSVRDEATFFQFIKKNMRSQPDEYARIREINAGLLEVDEEEADVMDLGKNECAASAAKAA
ncbi:MAG: MBL fold metallo-hydrolase [Deltaproteobacteria bacterium]|nr:MAG: MBL fold metallo-hydrolase [Deltaproteobacteria bacterium]